MKSRSHCFALTHDHGIPSFRGQNFDIATEAANLGRANEHHLDWCPAKDAFANRTINLASVGIAPNADVEGSKTCLLGVLHFTRQEDRARAGAKRWLHTHEFLQLFESCFAEKFKKGAGFAPRNDQSVYLVELLRFFDQHNCGAEFFEPLAVSIEVSLQSEDADFYTGRWPLVAGRRQRQTPSKINFSGLQDNAAEEPGRGYLKATSK